MASLKHIAVVALLMACAGPGASRDDHDLVIAGGRVIDPETGLNEIRHLGIRGGTISAVRIEPIAGRDTLDARGLVVSPGFIDLHQHAQDSAAYTAMVRGGTTSAFDLESGAGDVDAWYAARAGRAAVNHGVAVNHAAIRAGVMGDSAAARGDVAPSGAAAQRTATDTQLASIRRAIERGLQQGAVGVGLLLGYTPGVHPWEVLEVFRAAATHRASVHVHLRALNEKYWYLEVSELIGASAATGAPGHLVHINSSMQEDAPRVLDLLRGARLRGVDVTTEAYPYAEAMTDIESAMFDDWRTWSDDKFARYEWPTTGERLTRASFARYRTIRGNVIIHPADSAAGEAWVRATLADTLTIIASDGILSKGAGHPRATGTFSRVLGRYVREAKALPLAEAIRRMTLAPARRLESRVPAMKRKGRVQVNMDADLVVFDPQTVRDEATFKEPTRPPAGIPHVIVGGQVVVRDGAIVPGRLPGTGIRATAP